MKNYRTVCVACLIVLLTLAMGADSALAAKAISVGNGLSSSKDAGEAGADAAKQAKAALGDQKPELVLVYHSGDFNKNPDKVLEGVASVFDSKKIYGCSGYAALTQAGNEGTVAVLALGGKIKVTAAVAKTAGGDDDKVCGQKIGEALKEAAEAKGGKVMLLFGDCHVPRDDTVTKGVCSVLGEKFPIVGGAAGNRGIIYVEGKQVEKSNLGLLISGDFKCGFGLKKDMTPEGLVNSAGEAFKSAIGKNKDNCALVLVFDCGGRRGALLKHKSFPKELDAMRDVAGDAPIFGFYGSGEIGRADCESAPQGVGYHISACAIIAE